MFVDSLYPKFLKLLYPYLAPDIAVAIAPIVSVSPPIFAQKLRIYWGLYKNKQLPKQWGPIQLMMFRILSHHKARANIPPHFRNDWQTELLILIFLLLMQKSLFSFFNSYIVNIKTPSIISFQFLSSAANVTA